MLLSIKNPFLEFDPKSADSDVKMKIRRPSNTRYYVGEGTSDIFLPQLMLMLFLLISFGYMLPWTSLGSLISYYKYRYSAEFYVKIYCAYYLPGLPMALFQYQYDEILNRLYGSKSAYMWRGFICYVVMILILMSLSHVENEMALIYLFTLLGISSWLCHGTATMYASMFPKAAIAYLQIGFRTPELYAIAADHFLDLGMDADLNSLSLFYKLTAALVACSLICWVLLVESQTSTLLFEEKDRRSVVEYDHEETPLLGGASTSKNSTSSSAELSNIGRAKFLLSAMDAFTNRDAIFENVCPLCAALFVTMWSSIFQASFFAYVNSVSSKTKNIEQTLYFVRLVCDLLGRPMTFLPRPSFLQVSTPRAPFVFSFSSSYLLLLSVASHSR